MTDRTRTGFAQGHNLRPRLLRHRSQSSRRESNRAASRVSGGCSAVELRDVVENKGVEPFPVILQGSPAHRRVPRGSPTRARTWSSRLTAGRAACCTSGEGAPPPGVEPGSPASEAGIVSVGPQGHELATFGAAEAALAEDAGFEPARRFHADHRFRDGCLTGLGQSSRHRRPMPWPPGWSRCQELNLGRRLIRALHRPPCSTSCAEGARIERAPG